MKTVTIPASVRTIEQGAFDSCTSLTTVDYQGTPEQWASINKGRGNDALINAAKVTVSFDTQGGTAVAAITAPVRGGFTAGQVPADNPTSKATDMRYAYAFDGWYTAASGGSKVTVDLAYLNGLASSTTLYAHWRTTPIDYPIDYDLGGGHLPEGRSNPTSYNADTATFTLADPVRAGYHFIGWTGSNGDTPDTVITISQGSTGERTYRANWEVITYDIATNLEGGSVATPNPTSYTVESPDITLVNPTKAGHEFRGWTEVGGAAVLLPNVTIPHGSTGDRDYVAHWDTNTYNVVFDPNGGEVSPEGKNVTHDGTYGELPTPTREGYGFAGWYTALDGGERVTADTPIKANEHHVVYARWTPITYKITYDLAGGSLPEGKENPTEYTADSDAITLENPHRDGYGFAGWVGTGVDEPAETVTIHEGSTGDRSYRAVWEGDAPEPAPQPTPTPTPAETTSVLRLYNPWSGEHLYTTDEGEYAALPALGWRQEGLAWRAPASGSEVWRLYNPWSGDHLYTSDASEYSALPALGWRQEGVAFRSAAATDAGAVAVCRLFNPYAEAGTHLLTADATEYSFLPSLGWRPEGVLFYGLR